MIFITISLPYLLKDFMRIKNERGLTLVESLVSIALISVLLVGVLGAFYVSKTSTMHARHRITAMNLAREYMEKEISLGYYFGIYFQAAAIVRNVDGVAYTITPDPSVPVIASEGGVSYKLIGFRVTWEEARYGGAGNLQCSERVTTHVAQH